jgi:pimeloyl-ACP methyl ester carboxylesterase
MKHLARACVLAVSFAAVACGGDATIPGGFGGESTTSSTGASGGASSSSSSSGSGGETSSSSSSSSGSSSSSSGGGGAPAALDPNLDGPYAIAEIDDVIAQVPGGDTNVPVHCAHPVSGPSAGPYPIVVVGHGMQLPPSQYTSYVKRLATFGYVAMTVDFPASLFGVDNNKSAKDMAAGIDWAVGKPALAADGTRAGMSGHSLGGKTALLAATLDPRVKAAFVLDPVDAGGPGGCNPPSCVDVSSLMPNLHIPTGFLGETTDAMGGFMACAPAADNYTTFYAGAVSPSVQITALGANHMSFLDNVSTCGLVCSFCNPATAPNAEVNAMSRALMVAFYERHLRGDQGYEPYLTGAMAEARYVTTGKATIVSK